MLLADACGALTVSVPPLGSLMTSCVNIGLGLPPSMAASAGWLKGTTNRYCSAVPSTYWFVLVGVIPPTNCPFVFRGLRSWLAGLKTFFQLLALASIEVAVAVSPIAIAKRESAK